MLLQPPSSSSSSASAALAAAAGRRRRGGAGAGPEPGAMVTAAAAAAAARSALASAGPRIASVRAVLLATLLCVSLGLVGVRQLREQRDAADADPSAPAEAEEDASVLEDVVSASWTLPYSAMGNHSELAGEAHYYEVVVELLLRYFGVPATAGALPPCDVPSPCLSAPANERIRPLGWKRGGVLDYDVLVAERRAQPLCAQDAQAVGWPAAAFRCLARRGLDRAFYFVGPQVRKAVRAVFRREFGQAGTSIRFAVGSRVVVRPVPAASASEAWHGAVVLAFSFGVGASCDTYASCAQPGRSNELLADAVLHAVTSYDVRTVLAQWEVALALRRRVDASIYSSSEHGFTFTLGGGDGGGIVRVVAIGSEQQKGGYLSTAEILERMARTFVLSLSHKSKILLVAHPDHLPRAYRNAVHELAHSHLLRVARTAPLIIYPAMMPWRFDWMTEPPAISLFDLRAEAWSASDGGYFRTSRQPWTRSRARFLLYEIWTHALLHANLYSL